MRLRAVATICFLRCVCVTAAVWLTLLAATALPLRAQSTGSSLLGLKLTSQSSTVAAATIGHENLYDVVDFNPSTSQITVGNYVNQAVGADRFYQTGVLDDLDPSKVVGIFGQGTYTAHIDAGHPFAGPSGHESLTGMVVSDPNLRYSPTNTSGQSLVVTEPQAHATGVCMDIAGGGAAVRSAIASGGSVPIYQLGIAPLTNLGSGAVATSTSADGSFSMTAQTFLSTYQHFAEATWTRNINYSLGTGVTLSATVSGPTDVINTSFGYDDPTGTAPETIAIDALARLHPKTTFVISAGNSGPDANSVGGPASGYNVITVGATGVGTVGISPAAGTVTDLTKVADFSSRGPQDYADPTQTKTAVRTPVDIVAPGANLLLATYTGNPTQTGYYSVGASGTSFAAPTVAAGVALLDSLSYHLIENYLYQSPGQNFDNSRDSRVIKAVLLNSADKLPGWDNGQHVVNGVVRTAQGLDMTQGAGALNLNRAFDQYISGTIDPWGYAGTVTKTGWSLATVTSAAAKDYVISDALTSGNYLDATLTWFRDRALPGVDSLTGDWDPATSSLATTDLAMAELDLEIWNADFTTLYAVSDTPYNTVQHLHFLLPADGEYALRVVYAGQTFGDANLDGETFGLAWDVSAVPEPAAVVMLLVGLLALLPMLRKRGRGFRRGSAEA